MAYYPISKGDWAKYGCWISYSYGWHGNKFHDGEDYGFGTDPNVPIIASIDGTLRNFEDSSSINPVNKSKAKCCYITGDDGHGYFTAHHSKWIRKDGRVKAGEVIAIMGSTGYSTGNHCHFEIHKIPNNYGSHVDPAKQGLLFFIEENTMTILNPQIKYKTLNSANANIRSDATTKSSILGQMKPQQIVFAKQIKQGESITQNNRTTDNWIFVTTTDAVTEKEVSGWFGCCWADPLVENCNACEDKLSKTEQELAIAKTINADYTIKLNQINTISNI